MWNKILGQFWILVTGAQIFMNLFILMIFLFYDLKSDILSKVIVNGMPEGSWIFRRFVALSLKAVDLENEIVKWVDGKFYWFWVGAENPTNDPDDGLNEYSELLESFIDDDDEDDAVSSKGFYHKFENVNISVVETLEEEYKKSLADTQKLECSNLCGTSEE